MTLNREGVECRVADPCVQCEHGLLHRPVLMAYSPEAGDYVKMDDRFCTARWERRGESHAADEICGREAAERVGGVDLCAYHLERLTAWGFWEVPRRENEKARAALRESAKNLRREIAADEAERERIREQERARYSVVYFIRRLSDGIVKIGTSRSFKDRLNALRAEHGEWQVLLTVSGGHALETEMHRKFDMYRRPRTELFVPANPLLAFIYQQRMHPTYRDSQVDEAISVKEIRKLADAAPADEELQWKRGRAVWPTVRAA
jgi:Meiotically up-regulated gene 113